MSHEPFHPKVREYIVRRHRFDGKDMANLSRQVFHPTLSEFLRFITEDLRTFEERKYWGFVEPFSKRKTHKNGSANTLGVDSYIQYIKTVQANEH